MELRGFERWLLKNPAWGPMAQRVILPWALAAGQLPESGAVLELGTGGGFNAEVLLKRFPGWRLRATDYDPAMVELAARRLGRLGLRARLEVADATQLPYPDASFDAVVSILVWHHVEDWRAANRELRRVLKTDGRALLADIFGHRVFGPMGRFLTPSASYSRDQLFDDLAVAGLEVISGRSLDGLGASVILRRSPDWGDRRERSSS